MTAVSLAPFQTDKQAAAEFLGTVAADLPDPDPYHTPIPELALRKLVRMGDPGRAVLRRLAAENLVRHPEARLQLQELERRGWTLSPP